MGFESLPLTELLTVTDIVTIHYFEYTSTYHFRGESHDFWEFLCVDKGEVLVTAGNVTHILSKGQMIFHAPNEFHNVTANGKVAPNLVVISFKCTSPAMEKFRNLIVTIGETERSILARILFEAKQCISTPLDNPYTCKMEKYPNAPIGCEQIIKLNLELLMIHILRQMDHNVRPSLAVKPLKKKNDILLYARVFNYLETHLREKLTIEDICRANLVSRSQLQKLFREEHNCGVIDYFSHMKIEAAKQMIRENKDNFTEISEILGYTSIHYFSRQFKKITGMSPSEYASSIKALSEE